MELLLISAKKEEDQSKISNDKYPVLNAVLDELLLIVVDYKKKLIKEKSLKI